MNSSAQKTMKKTTQPTKTPYRVQIVLIGLPKGVSEAIGQLHLAKLVKGGNWLKAKYDKNSGKVTMTATITFML